MPPEPPETSGTKITFPLASTLNTAPLEVVCVEALVIFVNLKPETPEIPLLTSNLVLGLVVPKPA